MFQDNTNDNQNLISFPQKETNEINYFPEINSENKKYYHSFGEKTINEIQNNINPNLQNENIEIQNLIMKFEKLMNVMNINKNINVEKNKNNLKNFKRNIFINYPNGINFHFPNFINNNKELINKEIPTNLNLQKENSENNIYLGNKIKRKKNKNEQSNNILNNKKNDNDNKNYVMFEERIVKNKTNEIINSNEINDIIKYNYTHLTSIKQLLFDLNYQIESKKNKLFKKYYFTISKILFIITVDYINCKIVEIYEKKEKLETTINSDILISKELFHIENHLKNRLINK
jgi:hypothetical protein